MLVSYLEQAFPYMKTQNPKRLNLAKIIQKPITDEIQYNVYLFKCQCQSNKCETHSILICLAKPTSRSCSPISFLLKTELFLLKYKCNKKKTSLNTRNYTCGRMHRKYSSSLHMQLLSLWHNNPT